MTDHFDVAERRAVALVRLLQREGVPLEIIADGLVTNALGAWTAATGHHQVARVAVHAWHRLRVATDA